MIPIRKCKWKYIELGKIQLENRGKMNLRIKMKSQQYHICYRLRKKWCVEKLERKSIYKLERKVHLKIGNRSPIRNGKWKSNLKMEIKVHKDNEN